jgi:hypothetical protein
LLKEKGFNDPCIRFYYDSLIYYRNTDDKRFEPLYTDANKKIGLCLDAPIIAEVIIWLYEKHGIWISVECDSYGEFWYARLFVASKTVWNNLDKRHEITSSIHKFDNEHKSPKAAYDVAIEYTLNNLI